MINTLVERLITLRPEDIRVSDLDEMVDACHASGFSDDEIFGPAFGSLLTLHLGLMRLEATKIYELEFNDELYFVASLIREHKDGVGTICGFATKKGDASLNGKARMISIQTIMDEILTDAKEVGLRSLVCHVKDTNRPTLAMWKILSRIRKDVNITLTRNLWYPHYYLVCINFISEDVV